VKNTIYYLAKKTKYPTLDNIELFAREIIVHFLSTYPHVSGVDVSIQAHNWTRISVSTFTPVSSTCTGTAFDSAEKLGSHPHSFYRAGNDKRIVNMYGTKIKNKSPLTIDFKISSGLTDLYVLKTTGSSFTDFHKDQLTTLPEMDDRILSTNVEAFWEFAPIQETVSSNSHQAFETIPFDKIYNGVRQITLDIFANHDSPSVQNSLYRMGKVILEKFKEIKEISYSLPNKHVFSYDLERFGLKNSGKDLTVYMPISEPSGRIYVLYYNIKNTINKFQSKIL